MKIATFNINNINRRLPNLLDWLKVRRPDVVCLQELKATDRQFPRTAIADAGYGAAFVGQTMYTGDQSANEQALEDILINNDIPYQNLTSETEDKDIGYQASFGYRFHRFFSFEIGLVQYGEMLSKANAELDLGAGFVPAKVSLGYRVGGVLFSGIGVLPSAALTLSTLMPTVV